MFQLYCSLKNVIPVTDQTTSSNYKDLRMDWPNKNWEGSSEWRHQTIYMCEINKDLLLDQTSLFIQRVPLATEPDISLIILTPMKIWQRNLNRSTFGVWKMKRNVSQRDTWRNPSFSEDWCLVWNVPAEHNWSHLLRRNNHNSCIYGNLQHLCKSIWR